jgi:hypothetical protein
MAEAKASNLMSAISRLRKIAKSLLPHPPVSILFEQYSGERRMHVMQLFAQSTFEVDNALKSWSEKCGPDKIRKGPPTKSSSLCRHSQLT